MFIAAFIAGLVLFFVPHAYSAVRRRGPDVRPLGLPAGAYKGLYSLVTLVAFVAMILGYAMIKPWIPVWAPPVWTRHVAMAVMPVALVLIIATYLPAGYIKKAAKHPMLLAVIIWAAAHLLANGDLAGILLFGAFLVFAIFDRIAVGARGDAGAGKKEAHVIWDLVALATGGAAYGILVVYLHPVLFGAEIMPA